MRKKLEKEESIKRTLDEDISREMQAPKPPRYDVQSTKNDSDSDSDSSSDEKKFDPYEAMGLHDRGRTPEDVIKSTYNRLALILHPDRQSGKSQEQKKRTAKRMCEINRAKEILLDAERRRAFDEVGALYLHEVTEWRKQSKYTYKLFKIVDITNIEVDGGFDGSQPPGPGGAGGKGKNKYIPP